MIRVDELDVQPHSGEEKRDRRLVECLPGLRRGENPRTALLELLYAGRHITRTETDVVQPFAAAKGSP